MGARTVCVHGGGFSGGDPEQMAVLVAVLRQRAAGIYLPEYRLNGGGQTLDDAFENTRCAFDCIARKVGPGPLVLCGFSAGAAVGLMAQDVLGPDLRAIILFAPVTDLGPEGFVNRFVGPAGRTGLSPRHGIATRRLALSAPMLIVHGDADGVIPVMQSERFVQEVKDRHGQAQILVELGAGHGFVQVPKRLARLRPTIDRFLHDCSA